MDVAEGPIEYDAGQIVDLEQDDYRKRDDEDVKSIVLNTQMKASSRHNKPKKSNNAKVLPQDYECTKEDADIIEYMKATPEKRVLVNIDNNWVNRDDMDCLFRDGEQVNGAVLSAYIHCIRHEEHLQHREGGDVYLENTFISSLLKRDGDPKVALNYKDDVDYTRVEKYLHADMVFLPINIEKFHWYLAVVNAKKCEIHVLDSFGRELSDRRDLKTTLRGLERVIKLAAEHTQLYRDKWADIKVASWPIIDKITERMQTDGVSCGLWMINYMEYWTGITLSDHVTQDDISKFRFKLPAILWNSTLNTARGYQDDEQDKEVSDNPDDVIMINNPGEVTQLSEIAAGPQPSAKIFTDRKELLYWLSTYIWSIDDEECLDKEWVRSTRPYPISLSLRTLRDILDANKPTDCACFNMGVRTVACNEALLWLDDKFHYMDLQFCFISQFGRDPRRCDKLDCKKLVKLLECWPDMEYDISHCNSVLLPYRQMEHYTLYILDMGPLWILILKMECLRVLIHACHIYTNYITLPIISNSPWNWHILRGKTIFFTGVVNSQHGFQKLRIATCQASLYTVSCGRGMA